MKGSAALWIVAIVGLGFSALMLIVVNEVYIEHVQPSVDGLYNTTSVTTNIQLFGFLLTAMPWALVIFFIAYIIAQGQKRFPEDV